MTVLQEYYYASQLRRYLVQFMAIFAGMQVKVGQTGDKPPRLIRVPVANASKDRVAAWIKTEQTQNKVLRLPIMSAQLQNLTLDPTLRKGVGQTRRTTMMPTGGVYPTDLQVVQQFMPIPYMGNFELTIWASNQDQHYQMLEQLLLIFDPFIQMQVSDDVFDWTRITQVELTNINFEDNTPIGVDRRIIQTTLSFDIPIRLAAPAELHKRLVKEIFIRIGAVATADTTPEEIIMDLDGQHIPYEKIFDASEIDIDK